MGKKRVAQKTEKELIGEKDKIEKKLQKQFSAKASRGRKEARVYIYSTYNNTIITLTDINGDTLFWRTAGNIGFRGTKKGTSYASSKVAEAIAIVCQKMGLEKLDAFVKGVGGGRDAALKTLAGAGLEIKSIKDITPIPHNGCRPPKKRRT